MLSGRRPAVLTEQMARIGIDQRNGGETGLGAARGDVPRHLARRPDLLVAATGDEQGTAIVLDPDARPLHRMRIRGPTEVMGPTYVAWLAGVQRGERHERKRLAAPGKRRAGAGSLAGQAPTFPHDVTGHDGDDRVNPRELVGRDQHELGAFGHAPDADALAVDAGLAAQPSRALSRRSIGISTNAAGRVLRSARTQAGA